MLKTFQRSSAQRWPRNHYTYGHSSGWQLYDYLLQLGKIYIFYLFTTKWLGCIMYQSWWKQQLRSICLCFTVAKHNLPLSGIQKFFFFFFSTNWINNIFLMTTLMISWYDLNEKSIINRFEDVYIVNFDSIVVSGSLRRREHNEEEAEVNGTVE